MFNLIRFMPVGVAAIAHADVMQVPHGSLTGDYTETFEQFDAGNGFEGANYEDILSNGFGAHFAERFAGQDVSDGTNQSGSGVHDVVTGTPLPGLALAAGEATQNLVIGDTSMVGGTGHAMSGLSSVGWPSFQSIGEGAMAILFDVDQFEMGFTVFGDTGPGDLFVEFYGRDGTLLDSITINEVIDGAYAFRTGDGQSTIAGVLLTNNEDEGLSFDNFRYHLVPAPSAALVLLAGVGAFRRRR